MAKVVEERGCGKRVPQGIYLEAASSPLGQPEEYFIVDQPVPLDPDLELPAIGVKLVQDPLDQSVWHILDHVGSSHYPNVADFIEECKKQGLSRRLARNLDFTKLSEKSRIVLVHSRAIIENRAEIFGAVRPTCPKDQIGGNLAGPGFGGRTHPEDPTRIVLSKIPRGQPVHQDQHEMCAGYWWRDVEDIVVQSGETLTVESQGDVIHSITGPRHMPSFQYKAQRYRPDAPRLYSPGIVATYRCGRLVVIEDPDDPVGTAESVAAANNAFLPVSKEKE